MLQGDVSVPSSRVKKSKKYAGTGGSVKIQGTMWSVVGWQRRYRELIRLLKPRKYL
jgi:hypothetical protein